MRIIRYALLAVVAVLLVTVASANLDPITVRLMPEDIALILRYPDALNSLTLPLFVIILICLVAGVLLGYAAEWFREHKFRKAASRNRREADRLSSELKAMKEQKAEGDDVLALLDEAGPAR